ncbi:MAG: GNAT family N-acetyltransferase [Kiloniellales bacterium]
MVADSQSIYAGPARSLAEAEAARDLAARVFGDLAGLGESESQNHKRWLWAEPGGWGQSGVVVIVAGSGEVLGTVRLLRRVLHRGEQAFSAALFSSVCVDARWQGRGLSRQLVAAAVDQARALGAEIAYLIARRALDHYYTRFDFHGMSAYPSVDISRITPVGSGEPGRAWVSWDGSDTAQLCSIYAEEFAEVLGRAERDETYLEFHVERCRKSGVHPYTLIVNGAPAGYAFVEGSAVRELAFQSDVGLEALPALGHAVGEELTTADLNPRQRTARRLFGSDYDVSLRLRRCIFGGHMVRVLDPEAVASKLWERIAVQARRHGLGPQERQIGALRFGWDGKCAWSRLEAELGEIGSAATAALMGADLLDLGGDVLDQRWPMSIGVLDQG